MTRHFLKGAKNNCPHIIFKSSSEPRKISEEVRPIFKRSNNKAVLYIVVSCIISFLPWLGEQADWQVLRCIKSPYEFCFSANVNQFSGGQAPVPFPSPCGRWPAKTNALFLSTKVVSAHVPVCVCFGSQALEQIEPPVFKAPCCADFQAISPAAVIKPDPDLSSSYP